METNALSHIEKDYEIFDALVQNENDVVGLISYALYKSDEKKAYFEQLSKGNPFSQGEIDEYRQLMIRMGHLHLYRQGAEKHAHLQKEILFLHSKVDIGSNKKLTLNNWFFEIFAIEVVGAVASAVCIGLFIFFLNLGLNGNVGKSVGNWIFGADFMEKMKDMEPSRDSVPAQPKTPQK